MRLNYRYERVDEGGKGPWIVINGISVEKEQDRRCSKAQESAESLFHIGGRIMYIALFEDGHDGVNAVDHVREES